MKKIFMMLTVALVAFACNKGGEQEPEIPGVKLTSEKYVALPDGGTTHLSFKSTSDWVTMVTISAEFTEYVTVTPTSGKAGDDCKVTIVADDMPDGCVGRVFSVQIVPVDRTESATAYFGQGKFFVGIPETGDTVGIEGGKVSYHIFTNCKSFDVKKYDGPGEAFPFAPVTWDEATMTVTMDFQPNNTYDEREAYVKFFNINEIEEGYTVRTYGYQDAVPCIVYSINMADAQVDILNASVLSEAVYNGNHYVSTGKELYKINPADGKYEKIAWPWGNGMTQKVITNDDAGNLIVCNHTAYTGDAYVDGYFILNVVTPAGAETNLITKAAWECGGPAGAKIKVTGDITNNAMICLPVEGIEGIGMSNTLGYWQVTGGTVGNYVSVAVTGFVGPTWGAGYWHTYANWLPNVVAVGTTPEGGFVMSGVYDENCLYDVAKDGTATKKMTSTYMCGTDDCTANFALQSIDIRTIGGVKYLVVLASPQFPSWGWDGSSFPIVALHKVADLKSDSDAFTTANFCKVFPSQGAVDIMPAGEIALYEDGGNVGILYSDLNGGCVTAVSLDPKTL